MQNWDLSGEGHQFALALITFLYVDILDCTGTLYSMARFGGFIDERTQGRIGSPCILAGFNEPNLTTLQILRDLLLHIRWMRWVSQLDPCSVPHQLLHISNLALVYLKV